MQLAVPFTRVAAGEVTARDVIVHALNIYSVADRNPLGGIYRKQLFTLCDLGQVDRKTLDFELVRIGTVSASTPELAVDIAAAYPRKIRGYDVGFDQSAARLVDIREPV